MRKEMTPCEKLGYKVGDSFVVIEKTYMFNVGDMVSLQDDDGTGIPYFTNEIVKDEYPRGVACFLSSIKKIAKLKPAKQALADAIHRNGGWGVERFMYATSNYVGMVKMFVNKPKLENANWNADGTQIGFAWLSRPLPNWHQCVLSRDEYFTAYPEQVMVEIKNETKHQVEVEMKSESEITIKVSDWHKNGELPPVGEVCEAYIDYPPQWIETEIVAHKDGFAIGWCKSVMKGCHGDKAHEFRPLRTERDRAIDEMMEHCNYLGGRDFAGELFDAGYRREVK